MNEDEKWMQFAIIEANKAQIKNEIPIGAIIVKNGQLIAQAHNQPITLNDPTAHAEIQALRIAAKKQRNYRLIKTTLYVTLEPCLMCFGAINHARIERIVYGAHDSKVSICRPCNNLSNKIIINHKLLISGGVLENECSNLLKEFFKNRRNKKTNNS
jgi:tRNA(adenine34) deaminase